jgi:hypothetical protein
MPNNNAKPLNTQGSNLFSDFGISASTSEFLNNGLIVELPNKLLM